MENQPKIKPSRSQKNIDNKIKALRSQLDSYEMVVNDLTDRNIDFEKKKEFGGSLFLAGSALLLLAVLWSPICTLFTSICIIIWGIVVYFYGQSDSKEIQGRISETTLQIQKIEEELKKLKRKNNPRKSNKNLSSKK